MVRDVRVLAGLRRHRRGVTALEYGLIAALVGGGVIISSTNFGASITTAYDSIGGALTRVAGTMQPGAPAAPAPAVSSAQASGDGDRNGNNQD